MIKTGYAVFDEASENASKLYETPEEAQADLDGDITYKWSRSAVIMEIAEELSEDDK